MKNHGFIKNTNKPGDFTGLKKGNMEKNQNRTALEMAASIGSHPKEVGDNWKTFGMRNLNIAEQLEGMGLEMPIENQAWQKFLSQIGFGMIGMLDQKIENIQAKVVEQETAIELRQLFGQPLSLLAMPVFVELEKMELFARIDLKTEATSIEKMWEQIQTRVLYMIQLFLAEQIKKVEEEEKAHLVALKASQKEAEGTEALTGTINKVENKFSVKLEELETKKTQLLAKFKQVGGNMQNSIEGFFENTIFSASKQSTQPIAIN